MRKTIAVVLILSSVSLFANTDITIDIPKPDLKYMSLEEIKSSIDKDMSKKSSQNQTKTSKEVKIGEDKL